MEVYLVGMISKEGKKVDVDCAVGRVWSSVAVLKVLKVLKKDSSKKEINVVFYLLQPDNKHVVVGMSDGLLSIKYRTRSLSEGETAVQSMPVPKPGSYRYFVRGKSKKPEQVIVLHDVSRIWKISVSFCNHYQPQNRELKISYCSRVILLLKVLVNLKWVSMTNFLKSLSIQMRWILYFRWVDGAWRVVMKINYSIDSINSFLIFVTQSRILYQFPK